MRWLIVAANLKPPQRAPWACDLIPAHLKVLSGQVGQGRGVVGLTCRVWSMCHALIDHPGGCSAFSFGRN